MSVRALVVSTLLVSVCATVSAQTEEEVFEPIPFTVQGRTVVDLDGQAHLLGGRTGAQPTVLVFLGTECPIGNRSLPKLNALAAQAEKQGLAFLGVYSDPFTSVAQAKAHKTEFKIAFPTVLDGSGLLAKVLKPTHVPEAFVVKGSDEVLYRGAIDDGWAEPTKQKAHVTHTYLADAISAVAKNEPVKQARTQAVGCLFEAKKPPAPTYTRDIAPVLAANCVSCHRAGEVAPFSLTSYADAAKRSKFLAQVSREGLMPPWSPVLGHGEFLDERRISEEEVKLLEAWAAAGAPEGKAEDLPTARVFPTGWRMGEPDLVIEMAEAFEVRADGDDIFRNFVLPLNLTEDKQVVGFEYRPGAPKVVHHSILFLDDNQQGRSLAERAKGPGYPGFGGIGFAPSGALGGWAPGAQPVSFPKGIARHVSKTADVIMQVHYHPSGKVERDRGKVAIYFAKEKVNKRLVTFAMGTRGLNIPAGEANYERSASAVLPIDIDVIGAAPHMHYLGKEMKVWATTPEGKTVPIVWIKEWDFNWQGQYFYKKPLRIKKGSRLHLYARYDNSAENIYNPSNPPKNVRYGEQSFEEMCFCFLSITPEKSSDLRRLQQAMFQMFLPGELERRGWDEADRQEARRKRQEAKKRKAAEGEAKRKAAEEEAKPKKQRRRNFK